ncbi:dihydromonapterin reductase/dihydrofolate reductase [Tamilnaduibacter salinus]|uniref:Dihydromonapterin reductase/dihydrofolate reductase n=1 Tax=Tamilnaduibacter salinus TaxID=1484056 RepID=A0A2A2I4X6_9GAMM|nr:SDR family NAD(P)-dependent oxidoreductase [Tamilnaduibacter salinus]PAV27061.1 short-chain dehydrogenase [Tamilnaduibacter salinus]PVY77603.1 dihydromonapterin reductase/dihydrofolate reductase [Tamilnaduibacter salinus]
MATQQVAVVTGGGRRLGHDTSQALIDRGYHVIVVYRTRTAELEQLEAQGARSFQADLANPADVDALIGTLSREERIDLLVNNASEFTPDPEGHEALAEATMRLYQINAAAPILLMAGLSDALLRAGTDLAPSLIVNITDIFTEKPNPRFASYCASKAALSNATLSYARSLAPRVRVNAIMPGPIRFLPDHTDEQRDSVISETLLAREGGFEAVVTQLLAMVDNHFMTGALVPVDGGRRLA